MANRYFKATNGELTFFRRSARRVYRSITISPGGTIGFSSLDPSRPPSAAYGIYPAAEIGKAEYEALVRAKAERVLRDWKARRGDEAPPLWLGNSPQDSWVRNSEIAEVRS
jgi:hypothetical protein